MSEFIRIEDYIIPSNTAGTLARFTLQHIRPGGFIESVLLNDLLRAVYRADIVSLQYLKPIVEVVNMYVPNSIRFESYSSWLKLSKDSSEYVLCIKEGARPRWEQYLNY